jgi:hypothetical protein
LSIHEVVVDVLGVGDDDRFASVVGELESGEFCVPSPVPSQATLPKGESRANIGISSDDFTVRGSRVDGEKEKGSVIRRGKRMTLHSSRSNDHRSL